MRESFIAEHSPIPGHYGRQFHSDRVKFRDFSKDSAKSPKRTPSGFRKTSVFNGLKIHESVIRDPLSAKAPLARVAFFERPRPSRNRDQWL